MPPGKPHPEAMRRKLNDEANRKLAANVRRRGLSIFPVVGAGQEEGKDWRPHRQQGGQLHRPAGRRDAREGVPGPHQGLLHNPTGRARQRPVPSYPMGRRGQAPEPAQGVHRPSTGRNPTGPEDYRIGDHLGATAAPGKTRTLLHAVAVRPEGLGFDDGPAGQAGRPGYDQGETWTKIHLGRVPGHEGH